MDLSIDKLNGKVAYNDEAHQYWNTDNDSKYISVTTLIGKFEQPFDKDFWSAYKALEKLLTKDEWKLEKKNLLNTKRFKKEILDSYGIDINVFNKTQQDILDEWDETNREACERGTKIHAKLENSMYDTKHDISLSKFEIGGKFECVKGQTELTLENGVYPEYLISRTSEDGKLRIAGQIDLLVIKGNHVIIGDYKTNKEIKLKSGYDTSTRSTVKMKYPLNNLDDCNYWHYCMQLSTYAWMMTKLNPEYIIDDLVMIHFDHNEKMTVYHLPYLEKEVIRMLNFYKKEIIREEQKTRVAPIQY